MSYVAISKKVVGKAWWKSIVDALIDNQADFDARITLGEDQGIINASFESDLDADGDPDGFEPPTVDGSATYALTTTQANVHHGKQAFGATMTSASGDAVQLISENYTLCAPGQRINVPLYIKNASGIKVTVTVFFYYWTGSAWSAATTASIVGYTGSETLAAYVKRLKTVVAPGGANAAESYRVEFEVGGTGETTSGTVYLDGAESYIFRGTVPLTRTSKASGTVTLTLHDSNEHPTAGWFTVIAVASDAGTASLSISGTDQLTGGAITVWSESDTWPGGNTLALHTFRVPVNTSNQCSFTWNDGGGAGGEIEIYQTGYEV